MWIYTKLWVLEDIFLERRMIDLNSCVPQEVIIITWLNLSSLEVGVGRIEDEERVFLYKSEMSLYNIFSLD